MTTRQLQTLSRRSQRSASREYIKARALGRDARTSAERRETDDEIRSAIRGMGTAFCATCAHAVDGTQTLNHVRLGHRIA